jgi:hypothetical protein
MGTTLQKVAWVLGALIVGLILGASLHADYVSKQQYKAERVEAVQRAEALERVYPKRVTRQARHGAEKAVAEARMADAAASSPDWANEPVPEAVLKELQDEDYRPSRAAEPDPDGLRASTPAGSPE